MATFVNQRNKFNQLLLHMKKVKLTIGILTITFSALVCFSGNITKAEAIVWDKKPIDCTWHFGTQCTGQGDGCDAVACEQYKDPTIQQAIQ